MQRFEQCKSGDEIFAFAKKENIPMTREQAGKAFDLFKSEDIPDEALEKVAGGCGDDCDQYVPYCNN